MCRRKGTGLGPLLVAQTVQLAAFRTNPVDAVAGQAPEIFVHAVLANGEMTMPALPAERVRFLTAVACVFPGGFSF
jgi:hypothetical protein